MKNIGSKMRTFEGKNFYEILSIPPNSDPDAVRQAHAEALEMYGESAVATYALFSDEEREKILRLIHEAYQTLASKEKRAEYDRTLIATGRVDAAMFSAPSRNRAPGERPPDSFGSGSPKDRAKKQAAPTEAGRLIHAIYEKSLVSGEDLRALREALGIEIPEIYAKTRISRTTIERIEKDQYEDLPVEIYLKSFLKSYAEILGIEPRHVIEGYFQQKANAATK